MGVGPNYLNLQQGGFQTDGRIVTGAVALATTTGFSNSTQATYVAETITEDAWNYGISTGAGSISLGMTSPSMNLQTTKSFLLESGAVTSQTFAGGQAPMATPNLYIGAGDYTTLFNSASP